MITGALLLAITVLPADRLALADRLFNRGDYQAAAIEYKALQGEKTLPEDVILFRMGECARAQGNTNEATRCYATLRTRFPQSAHAAKATLLEALSLSGEARTALLNELNSDRVEIETRTAALYHLGIERDDAALLEQCVKLSPKGQYAAYANLRRAAMLEASEDSARRRKGLELLLGIAFSGSKLAPSALYAATSHAYRERNYGEAATLCRRYLKAYPQDEHVGTVRTTLAWCDYMSGHYADAAAACGAGTTDDFAYLKAAATYALGEKNLALTLFRKYLETYPSGRYRTNAELPIAHLEFETARATNDTVRLIDSAKRAFALSKKPDDALRLAWAYAKIGDTQRATSEYAALARQFPNTDEAAEALYLKALEDVRSGNWSAADLALAEAIASGKLREREANARYWRGIAACQLDHEAEAADLLKDALARGLGLEESREARLILAAWDLKNNRVEEAKAAYRRLVNEGACERMNAARIHQVGKLLSGAESATCARALTASDSAEWRQAGWTLLGTLEEAQGQYTAAMESYRKGLNEKAQTESAADAALRLGKLAHRAGLYAEASQTLERAVTLNVGNAAARAEAYLTLAENAQKQGNLQQARAYATVVTSLFDNQPVAERARQLLTKLPEEKK